MPPSTLRIVDGVIGAMSWGRPELVAAAAVAQIDLVADLAAPAGAGQHHGNVLESGLAELVVGQVQDPGPEECPCHLR
jgi:hypothetical protein